MKLPSRLSRIAVLIASLLLSLGLFQVAFASGDLEAADADSLTDSPSESSLSSQAVTWRSIMTPEQLRLLYSTQDGFGPGYYRIDADFTLGADNTGDQIGTCALLKGNYVIDFNGHTVQSACENLSTFTVQGADVTFMDSKASAEKVSINAWGLGCIEVRDGTNVTGSQGSATIVSGNYLCQKYTDAGGPAISNSGGTLTVNGGAFQGSNSGLTTGAGTTIVNGGTFYGGYPWAFLHMGGNVKIIRGAFYAGKGGGGYSFAIGALSLGNVVDFSPLFADGSTWSNAGVVYWGGTSTSPTYMPGALSSTYAAIPVSSMIVSGPQTITASNVTKTFGDGAFDLNAKTNGDGKLTYSSSNANVATVDSAGKVTIKGAGTANITISASATDLSKAASKTITLTVNKAANPLAVTAKDPAAFKFGTAKRTIANPLASTGAQGTVTYSKSSGSKYFTVASNGVITAKAKTPAGTYSLGITAKATGNANYNAASVTRTVKVTIARAANSFAAKTVKAKQTVSRNKKTTLKASKVWKVTKNKSKGKVTYKKVSGNAKITVAKNGNVTVKKGLKKGTCTIKVKLTAAKTTNYKAATKTLTLKVRVK